ncbi:MAG TPA: hypothetical protein VNE62_09545 [Actinomycetota bacterium]|nr:hypothetical protein [Actinomycetota bacterium]
MIEVTVAAATQIRLMARAAGVEGVPGVRIMRAVGRGSDSFELIVEDRRQDNDVVVESRGIRFYLDADAAALVQQARLVLEDREFVLRQLKNQVD